MSKSIFLILTAACLFGMGMQACARGWGDGGQRKVVGEGPRITQSRGVSAYERLVVDAPVTVDIVDGKQWALEISGCANQLKMIRSDISGERLVLSKTVSNLNFRDDQPVHIVLTVPGALSGVELSDRVRLNVSKPLEVSSFSVRMEDMAHMGAAGVRFESLTVDLSDMCGLTLSGKADYLDVKVEDMSSADLGALEAGSVACHVEDMSHCRVSVSDRLGGIVTDMSHLVYLGTPGTVDVKVEDMSSMKRE